MGKRFGLGRPVAQLPSVDEFAAKSAGRDPDGRDETASGQRCALTPKAAPLSSTKNRHDVRAAQECAVEAVSTSSAERSSCRLPASGADVEPIEPEHEREMAAQRIYERLIRRLRGADAVGDLISR